MFLIIYLWIGFFVRGFFVVFMLAFLSTVVINYAWMAYSSRQQKKKNLTKAEKQRINDTILAMKFMPRVELLELFYSALVKKFPDSNVALVGGKVSVNSGDKRICLFPFFHKNATKEDIIECIHMTDDGAKTLVCTDSFSHDVRAFFDVLDINLSLVNGEMVFSEILEPAGVFPKNAVKLKDKKKIRIGHLKNMIFDRRKSKHFVIVGVIILLTSIIVSLGLYYIIVATIVFGFALIGYLRPIENKRFLD